MSKVVDQFAKGQRLSVALSVLMLNRCWGLTCNQGWFKITDEMVKSPRGRIKKEKRKKEKPQHEYINLDQWTECT